MDSKELLAILSGITGIIGIRLTYKNFISQNMTFLRPLEASAIDLKHWKINIKNFGNDLAKNVTIKTVVAVDFEWDDLEPKSWKIWTVTKLVKGEGPYEIEPGEQASYSFKYLMSLKYPFLLSWETIKGKKQRGTWTIQPLNARKIYPVGKMGVIKFYLIWYLLKVITPFQRCRKKIREVKAKHRLNKNK